MSIKTNSIEWIFFLFLFLLKIILVTSTLFHHILIYLEWMLIRSFWLFHLILILESLLSLFFFKINTKLGFLLSFINLFFLLNSLLWSLLRFMYFLVWMSIASSWIIALLRLSQWSFFYLILNLFFLICTLSRMLWLTQLALIIFNWRLRLVVLSLIFLIFICYTSRFFCQFFIVRLSIIKIFIELLLRVLLYLLFFLKLSLLYSMIFFLDIWISLKLLRHLVRFFFHLRRFINLHVFFDRVFIRWCLILRLFGVSLELFLWFWYSVFPFWRRSFGWGRLRWCIILIFLLLLFLKPLIINSSSRDWPRIGFSWFFIWFIGWWFLTTGFLICFFTFPSWFFEFILFFFFFINCRKIRVFFMNIHIHWLFLMRSSRPSLSNLSSTRLLFLWRTN